jgi:tetratricopeptide (TPR) repeat protein
MILHCRSVKAAVVTVIALVVIGGLWQGSASQAWALEQVLTAMEDVRTMHVRGTLLYGKEPEPKAFRLWVQAPGEEAEPLRMRFECSGLVILLDGERVYTCRPNKGWALLRHGPSVEYFMPWYDAAELGPWVSGKMFTALQEVFADWKQTVGTDPETGRKKITVSCRYAPTNMTFRAVVDDETKLIDSATLWSDPSASLLKLRINAQAFAYNQEIAAETFALPGGTRIVDEAALREAEALLEKGMPLFEAKQYAEALAVFEQVCEAYPGLHSEVASARLMIGHCHRELDQREKAIAAYQRAVETAQVAGMEDFTNRFLTATAYLSLGRTYAELGQDAKALEAFKKCIAECEDWAGPEKWPHKEALEATEALRKP